MALSGREVLLILRARDEATRVIGRVSSAMRRMDRDAVVSSQGSIRQAETDLIGLRRHAHDINQQYRLATISAREMYQAGRMTGPQFQAAMLDARRTHTLQADSIRLEKQALEDLIRTNKIRIADINAQREASRHLGQQIVGLSTGAIAFGAGLTYAGAAGVIAFGLTAKAAMDYEEAARRTLTQVDNNRIGLNRVAEAGKRIADTVPVAFDQIQPAMYDVFSSIDVNMREASRLTKQFAKDAVGGTTEIAVATRANLAIMNAYKIGVEDVTEVSDFMFQLVRKGVGSYQEFATTIGRSIPSAVRAGQTYQTLGAMLAFMTRNGLSAAMASTSAARALDAISHPKTVDKMEKMGIQVKNLRGEFLPLPKILDQLNDKFGDLTSPQRAKALYELFKSSGGTIQARRFFDAYFKNADEFNQRTREMSQTAGEAQKAFEKMAASPQAKLRALQNDFRLLAIEIGADLMPIVVALMEKINQAIDWFQSLDEETKHTIITFAAWGAAAMVLIGVIMMVMGAIGLFVGGMKMIGIGAGLALTKVGNLAAGLTLLGIGMHGAMTATTDAQKALSTFEMVAGGAVAGFAVGGPIGAAVGALAGLFGSVAINASRGGDSIEEASKKAHAAMTNWSGLKNTLNQTTGAIGEMTAEFIKNKLVTDGTAANLAQYGVSLRTAIQATLGNKAAIERVNYALKVQQVNVDKTRRSWKEKAQALKDWQEADHGVDRMAGRTEDALKREADAAREAYLELRNRRDAIKSSMGALKSQRQEVRENAATVGKYGQALKDLPKKLRQQIQLENVPQTKKELAQLVEKYDQLNKKDVKTLIKATGVKTTVGEIMDIKQRLEKLHAQKTEPKVEAEIGDAIRKIGVVVQTLNNIQDEDVWINIHTKRTGGSGGGGTGGGSAENRAFIDKEKKEAFERFKAVREFVTQAAGGFPDTSLGAAGSAMVSAFQGIEEQITKATDRQLKRQLKKSEEAYQERRKQFKKNWDGSKQDLDKKLAEMDRAHEKHVRQIEAKYKRLTRLRIKGLGEERQAVRAAAAAYDATAEKLEEWTSILEQRQGTFDQHVQSIRDMVVAYGSLSGLGKRQDAFGEEVAATSSTIIQDLEKRVADAQRFQQLIAQLTAEGMSPEGIQQLLSLGVADGLGVAEAIAAGGPGAIAAISSLFSQLDAIGTQLGIETGNIFYGEGIHAAQEMVTGLKEQLAIDQREVIEAMQALGNAAGDAIHQGLKDKEGNIYAAVRQLAKGMEDELREAWGLNRMHGNTQVAAPTGGSGGGGWGQGWQQYYNQNINIHTNEIDPRANAAAIGWELANRTNV